MNKDKTTRKKVKIIGKETYIKQDTGEITDMQVIIQKSEILISTRFGWNIY